MFSRSNALNGFEGSGIYPLNKEKILSKSATSTLLLNPEDNNPIQIKLAENEQIAPTSPDQHEELDEIKPTKKLELSLMSVLRSKNRNTKKK